MWFDTQSHGLERFDLATETFTHYPPNPQNPKFDRALLRRMNTKLNTLIEVEIGEDKFPLSLPE